MDSITDFQIPFGSRKPFYFLERVKNSLKLNNARFLSVDVKTNYPGENQHILVLAGTNRAHGIATRVVEECSLEEYKSEFLGLN